MFTLAGERCALPVNSVREIVRAALPARLPKAPPIVLGVLNIRGELVPLLDVRQRFGLRPRDIAPDDHILVLTVNGRPVSFAVDRALDLASVPASAIRAAADVTAGAEHVSGIARMDDGALVIYDLGTFLSAAETLELDAALAGSS